MPMKTINTLPIPWLKAIKEYIEDNSSDYSKARLRIYTRMPKFNNDKPYPLPTATLDKVLKHKKDSMRNPNGTFRIPRTYTIELDTFEKNTFNINIITL